MNRDEIYDHLAQVYLGKREVVQKAKPPRMRPQAWLVLNVVITGFILASVIWGLTAFLTQSDDFLKSRVIYKLNNSPIHLTYNVGDNFPQVKELVLDLPDVDASKYRYVHLSIRGEEQGHPGMLKIVLMNERNEKAEYYLQGVKSKWQDYVVSFEDLNLTDWKSLKDIAFVVESWNAVNHKGAVFIDNISFSN